MNPKRTLILAYLGSFFMLFTRLCLGGILVIFFSPLSSDAITIYSSIIFAGIMLIMLSILDMNKNRNIIILSILNFLAAFMPISLIYLCTKYLSLESLDPSWVLNSNNLFEFLTNKTYMRPHSMYYVPAFLLISIYIISCSLEKSK